VTQQPSPWGVFALVGGATVVGAMNFAAVFVAFTEIIEEFGASGRTASWAITAFSITLAALVVPAGWLADRIGRKQVFLLGVVTFTIGSLFVALAPSIEILILFRMVQAAGLAMEGPSALAIVLDAFPDNRRSTAVGALGALGGLAIALSPVIGGALIESIGWRWAFGSGIPLGVITAVVGYYKLPDSRSDKQTGAPDFLGIVAFAIGIASLVLGIVQSDNWGITSSRTLLCFVVAVGLIGAMVRRSAVHPTPVLELSLYQVRTFTAGNLLSVLLAGSFAAAYLSLITLLTDVWGYDKFQAGQAMAMIPAIAGPLSFVSGSLADRIGPRRVIAPGGAFMTAGALWLYLGVDNSPDFVGLWLPAIGLYSIGVGFAHAASQGAAMRDVPSDVLGIGSAMSRIMQEIGNATFVAIAIVLLAVEETASQLAGVRRVLLLLTVASAIGAIAATQFPITSAKRESLLEG
jgi:EmrB/QacA subfamily drug resistance transporter